VKPLPDDGGKAVEISFPARAVEWVKVTVTAGKPGSPNIGFSEVAVFKE